MATTVLIVDDSKLARIVVGKAVAAAQPDWSRVEASNAEEALAIIAAQKPHVAIFDFNMPGMNGIELAEKVRAEYPAMPLAIATANIQDEIISRARAAGAVFVPKPITEESLKGFLTGAALQLRKKEQ